jgi:hypothetical protein
MIAELAKRLLSVVARLDVFDAEGFKNRDQKLLHRLGIFDHQHA